MLRQTEEASKARQDADIFSLDGFRNYAFMRTEPRTEKDRETDARRGPNNRSRRQELRERKRRCRGRGKTTPPRRRRRRRRQKFVVVTIFCDPRELSKEARDTPCEMALRKKLIVRVGHSVRWALPPSSPHLRLLRDHS